MRMSDNLVGAARASRTVQSYMRLPEEERVVYRMKGAHGIELVTDGILKEVKLVLSIENCTKD